MSPMSPLQLQKSYIAAETSFVDGAEILECDAWCAAHTEFLIKL